MPIVPSKPRPRHPAGRNRAGPSLRRGITDRTDRPAAPPNPSNQQLPPGPSVAVPPAVSSDQGWGEQHGASQAKRTGPFGEDSSVACGHRAGNHRLRRDPIRSQLVLVRRCASREEHGTAAIHRSFDSPRVEDDAGAVLIGAGASYLRSRQRRPLLKRKPGPRQPDRSNKTGASFEMLVGEAFRRRGYAVEETGLGGQDGGIDLTLRKDGRKELIQCKQWRKSQVSVAVVREMWGLAAHGRLTHQDASALGSFTPDAVADFAREASRLN